MKVARLGVLFLMVALCAGVVFAEGAREGTTAQEPVVIKWFGSRGFPGDDAVVPGLLAEMLSDKVGFPVEWELTGTAESSSNPVLQRMLAANDLPDCFLYIGLNEDFLSQAAAPIELSEILQNMPELTKYLRQVMESADLDEQATWDKYLFADSKMMKGVPRIWDTGWIPGGQMWRKDIVDELGYEIPSTIDEAEEVFEAFKATYPDRYVYTTSGSRPTWQAFSIVFNAFGLQGHRETVRDGKIVQDFTTREFREALLVLRRWYEKGFIDPNFINTTNIDKFSIFASGSTLVVDWAGNTDWDYMSGENTRYLNPLREVPGAVAVAARPLAKDENSKPIIMVWDPFLTQVTAFGNHLSNDHEKIHKIMQVADVLTRDMEAWYLASSGIEGEHYVLDEDGLPEALPEIASMSVADQIAKYGFGYYWTGTFSYETLLSSRTKRVIEQYVTSPGAMYSLDSIDYWYTPMVPGPVTDERGEPVQVSMPTSQWQLIVDVMTGQQPIEYYDEWVDAYYDGGGHEWERNATRLYLK